MTILILGADGFIGRHIAFALRSAGWEVLASARHTARLERMGFATLSVDLSDPACHDPGFWRPRVEGVTHVVNAAGLLTGSAATMAAVHEKSPAALYAALPEGATGLLLSAVGIDRPDTGFARHRRAGEALAQSHRLTILRAGLVLGETSYGGSSLARALAALPLVTPLVAGGAQPVNPIHARDLAAVIETLLRAPRPGEVLEIGGPETLTQSEMLAEYRRWLGLPPARALHLPLAFARLIGRAGDALALGPIASTSVAQLTEGVVARTSPGLTPAPEGFRSFLWRRPAGTQDLWQARLYLMRPALRLVLALMWLASGLIGLTLPAADFVPLMSASGLPEWSLVLLARLGGLVDLGIAVALLRGWRLRLVGWVQAGVVALYTAGLTLMAPALWLLPLGGLLKNLPILMLVALHLVLEEER